MLYILFAILFFGFLVAIHEAGHFIVAKLCNVRVNEFSIGMGPLIFHKQGKETKYSFRLLPVGGFCAMEGEDEETDDPRSFAAASAFKRLLILVAGSAMNFLAGVVILLIVFSFQDYRAVPVIDSFAPGCPAYEEGYLMVGDEILEIDGKKVWLTTNVTTLLSRGNAATADVTIRRDGARMTLEDVPLALREYTDNGTTSVRYGLNFTVEPMGLLGAAKQAWCNACDFCRTVWLSLQDLITGVAGLRDLSGPIGIVSSMSAVGEASPTVGIALMNLFYFGAFIAVNLAVMNLLPLPALDGGRLLFLVVNTLLSRLIGRTIPGKYESYVHFTGLALLLALMAVVAINDVFRIFGS